MATRHEISGGCHCGNIVHTVFSPWPKTDLPLYACGRSFCTRQGARYTSHPRGRLQMQLKDASRVDPYRFGSEIAAAMICSVCGDFCYIRAELDGQTYAVLNATSIDGLHIDNAAIPPALHLTDFSVAERIERWKKGWIGQVEINTSP